MLQNNSRIILVDNLRNNIRINIRQQYQKLLQEDTKINKYIIINKKNLQKMSKQIYVGRISSKIVREDLQKEFEKFGKILDIDLRPNRAFIEFSQPEEARDAIDKMDGKRLGGDRITCKPRDDRPSGGARGPTSRDVCYNCGRKGHWANQCKEGDLRDTCYRCFGKGHIKKDCTRSRTPSQGRRSRKYRKRRRSSSSSNSSSESSRSARRHSNKHRQKSKKVRRHTPSSSERSSSSSSQSSKKP
ncbi:hypothetical protein pb186bvf_006656 [Paramecium bursaria]